MKLKSLILIVGLMIVLVSITTEAKRRGGSRGGQQQAAQPPRSTKMGPERREEVRQRFRDQNKFVQFKSRKEAGEAARRDGGGKPKYDPAHKPGEKPHAHSMTRDGNRANNKHYQYPKRG